jgi:hypothetical protein
MARHLPDPDDGLFETAHEAEERERRRYLRIDRPGPMGDLPAEDKSGSLTPLDDREPEGALKPIPALQAVLEIVEPEVMQWAPTAEDLAWMERAYKPVKTMVTVPDLPWLPQGPAKIIAVLRSATDHLGTVTLSQTAIVEQTGLDRRYVQRILDRLVESTLLEVVRPGYRYKKADGYKYQPSQYRFSPTPNRLQAKAVLLRPAGRPRKLDRLGGRNETA